MAEYIDKEQLLSDLYSKQDDENLDVMLEIANFPAADVAPVVRCRDCKWYESAHEVCELTSNESIKNFVGENAFCSYGEKWEDSHE